MKTSEAIEHFGSAIALAKVLGIARQAIYQWGEFVPESRAFQIQVITNGALVANPGIHRGTRLQSQGMNP